MENFLFIKIRKLVQMARQIFKEIIKYEENFEKIMYTVKKSESL